MKPRDLRKRETGNITQCNMAAMNKVLALKPSRYFLSLNKTVSFSTMLMLM